MWAIVVSGTPDAAESTYSDQPFLRQYSVIRLPRRLGSCAHHDGARRFRFGLFSAMKLSFSSCRFICSDNRMFAERAFYCFNVPESEFAPAAYTSISCQSGKTLQKKIKILNSECWRIAEQSADIFHSNSKSSPGAVITASA